MFTMNVRFYIYISIVCKNSHEGPSLIQACTHFVSIPLTVDCGLYMISKRVVIVNKYDFSRYDRVLRIIIFYIF